MVTVLIDRLHQCAEEAVRHALNAVGLEEVKEFRLSPPKDASMGDLGLACHPFARVLRKNPKVIAEEIAAQVPETPGIAKVDAVNGYLNIAFDEAMMIREAIQEVLEAGDGLGHYEDHKGETFQIEFSGPNTNKPQHLGHVRNNVLGLATANLLDAVGYDVVRTNIINDRGIAICKSMLAYKKYGEGVMPEDIEPVRELMFAEGVWNKQNERYPKGKERKGDFLVGDFYVLFDKKFNAEYTAWQAEHPSTELSKDDYFNGPSALGQEARAMLRAWEAEDAETRALWATMNSWVYDGFNETYKRMGVRFDWIDYESDTYVLGKAVVEQGVERGYFVKREDGAVVCPKDQLGLDNDKVLLRSDGTSLYMTQDLGTANRRFEKFNPKRMMYVVANEQDYHFKLLFGILNLMEKGLGDRCRHLSYGMVELPHGKMKSREGTVVDADFLMDDLRDMALAGIEQRYSDLSETEKRDRAEKIGQSGLKFFLLKQPPPSKMKFDPEKSIEFQGETGPYCLYTYARVNSIAAKVAEKHGSADFTPDAETLSALGSPQELAVVKVLMRFPRVVRSAAEGVSPAELARYLFELANQFSSFYQHVDHRVVTAEGPLRDARLALCRAVQAVLGRGLSLLGIETVEQM